MSAAANERAARRILVLAGALILTDTMFFNAVTPLLPHYAHEYGMSKAGAGLLAAMYPFGTFTFALVSGAVASKLGVKVAVLIGLAGLGVTSVAFGFATSVALLDASRFVQGASGSFVWTGSLTWLVTTAPPERRGQFIGIALGTAIGGSMIGPVLGGLASAVGTGPAFSVVAVVAVVQAGIVISMRATPAPRMQSIRLIAGALRHREIRLGIWFVLLPALATGTIFVLAPLSLSSLGLSGFGIGVCLLIAAVCEAVLSPVLGALSDRRGRALPLLGGLLGTTLFFALLPWPGTVWLFTLVMMGALMATGAYWAPGFSLLSDASERCGLDYALGFALMSLAWAPGQAIGAAVSGAVANATSDAVPYLCVAGITALTFVVARRWLPGGETLEPAPASVA